MKKLLIIVSGVLMSGRCSISVRSGQSMIESMLEKD